jgi:asparagine synthase (glutamine-hydrolysing)
LDAFEHELAKAVKARMVSDVPLGAFLSGGFDSSAVVAMMQSQSSRPVKTFSIGFTERGYDEAPYAKSVAQHLKTDHTEMYVTPREAMDVIPLLPRMYDEPFADSSQIPTYLVAKLARQHVKVALSGDAGDELLGGYARYFISNRTLPAISRLPMGARRLAAGAIRGIGSDGWDALYHAATFGRGTGHIGDRALKFAGLLDVTSPLEGYRAIVSSWQRPDVLVAGVREPTTALNDPAAAPPGLDFVEQMMFLDTVSYLPGDILTKVDRATMAVSLEGRVPFLDPALLDFVWRLPLNYKVRGGVGKWLLRQVVYRHIPCSIMDRPKMGFGIPLKDWLRGPLRDWAEALLAPSKLNDAGLVATPIRLAWRDHLDGRRNCQHMLWPVLMYVAWKEAITQ